MNDERRHQVEPRDEIDWSSAPEASRVRALSDGELPAGEERELRVAASSERVDRAVAFERALRERVGAAMSGAGAPSRLRERVEAALRQGDEGDAAAGVIRRPSRGFWSGGAGRWLALAAALALVATAFVFMPTSSAPAGLAVLTRASEHISAEHSGCITNPAYFSAKLDAPAEGASAEELVSRQIGDLPVHLDLDEAGYRLAGLGECHVPGGGDSVHLLYEPRSGEGETVSLFIQEATVAHEGLREGVVYTNGRPGPPMIRIWREGAVIYHVVTACSVACDAVEKAYALTGERTPI